MTAAIRVLVVDDHEIVRNGLRALMATEAGIDCVGEAADGKEGVAEALRLRPDVVLMDLEMPVMDGIEAAASISTSLPDTRVLVLTSFSSDDKVFPAIKAGAQGYLLKDSSPEDLVHAIRRVHAGESSLHPAIARRLLQELSRPRDGRPAEEPLTEREHEVIVLVAKGMSNREIGAALGIGDNTVRTHVSSILSKLHLASRTQAALYALRHGIAGLDDDGGAPAAD